MSTTSTSNTKIEFGGIGSDEGYDIVQLTDGYIFVGHTESNDQDVTGFIGAIDVWVVKLNNSGDLEWEKCFGGTGFDFGQAILKTTDGILIGSTTSSNDIDVTDNNGADDMWVISLDLTGNLMTQKCLGGSSSDFLNDLITTSDSTYVVSGISFSSGSGNLIGVNNGSTDVWIVKLNSDLEIIDQAYFGGSDFELTAKIANNVTGELMVCCETHSDDNLFSDNPGSFDVGVVKLDSSLNIILSECFGGSGVEESWNIVSNPNGKFTFIAATTSIDGDVLGSDSLAFDTWLAQVDGNGDLEWSMCYGGLAGMALADVGNEFLAFLGVADEFDPCAWGFRLVKLRGALSVDFTVSDTASCDISSCPADIDLNILGGFSPYTITWSNGETTEDLTNICSGTYDVTVTDSTGTSTTASIVVNTTSSSLPITAEVTNASCYLSNGSINITPNGTPPYQYQWNNGMIDEDLDSMDADTYIVTITDATGCSIVDTFPITTTPQLYFTATASPSCDATGGSINVNVSDGTSPFVYLLNNDTVAASTNALDSGTYILTVIDSAGCTQTETINILQGSIPTACFTSQTPPCSCAPPDTMKFTSCSQPAGLFHDWMIAGGNMQPPFYSTSQIAIYNTAGSFLVGLTVSDSAGCSDMLWLFDYVQINDDTVYILNPVDSFIEVTQSYTFFALNSPNYDWSVNPTNGTFTTSDTASQYTVYFGNTGTFQVCVKTVYPNSCGVCEVEDCIFVVVKDTLTSFHQGVSSELQIMISPNPTAGNATLYFSTPTTEATELNVYTATGIKAESVNIPVNTSSLSLEVGTLPRGLYFYNVIGEDKRIRAVGKLALQ